MSRAAPHVRRRTVLAGLAALGPATAARAQLSLDVGGLMRSAKAATIGEKDEIAYGRKLYEPTLQEMGGAYRNPAVQAAVAAIARPIFRLSQRKAFDWDVRVVDSNEVNAWCLPGGKVGVHKGLLRYVASEDELAAVLAHEMAHAEFSHAAKEMRKRALTAVAAVAASTAAADDDHGGLSMGRAVGLGAIDLGLIQLATQGYSREYEEEADRHIATVFQATGYDLARGAEVYRTLLQVIPPSAKGRSSLFAGHPDTRKRLAALTAGLKGGGAPARSSDAFAALKTTFPTRRIYQRAVS